MNQILFEIHEIPLVVNPEAVLRNKIKNITGYYRSFPDDKEYKYALLEYDEHGFLENYEKYDSSGKLVCKRSFDKEGKLLNDKHFIGSEKLEFQYDIEYLTKDIVKTMKDPQGNDLGRTIISPTSDNKQYKVLNYNKEKKLVSELEYIYKNGCEFPDITSKAKGEYSFKEEGDKIVLTENVPSAPKNNPDIIFYRDRKSMQIIKVEKKNGYAIHYKIHTY